MKLLAIALCMTVFTNSAMAEVCARSPKDNQYTTLVRETQSLFGLNENEKFVVLEPAMDSKNKNRLRFWIDSKGYFRSSFYSGSGRLCLLSADHLTAVACQGILCKGLRIKKLGSNFELSGYVNGVYKKL